MNSGTSISRRVSVQVISEGWPVNKCLYQSGLPSLQAMTIAELAVDGEHGCNR
jgi:hypothetical protein